MEIQWIEIPGEWVVSQAPQLLILLSLQIVSGIGIITAIYALASEGTAEKAADKVARRDDIGVGGGGKYKIHFQLVTLH